MRYLFLLLILICSCAKAQQGYRLRLHVQDLSANEQKKIYFKAQLADSDAVYREATTIINQLQFKGYLLAEVRGVSFENGQANINLLANKLYHMVRLGAGNVPLDVLRVSGWKRAKFDAEPFKQQQLEAFFNRILGFYENNGYPFASISMDSIVIGQATVASQLNVVPGPNIRYDSLKVMGTARVNTVFLQSYLGVKSGRPYQESRIKAINDRLRELPYLQVRRQPEVQFNNENASVNVFADQRNANQFDGVLGLQQNSSDNKLQLVGNLKLLLQNVLRGGELIDFSYQSLPPQSQLLDIKSSFPHVFKTDFGLIPAFKLYKQDTSFLNLNLKLGISYLLSGQHALQFFVERQTTSLIATQAYQGANVLPGILDAGTNFYGLGLLVEKLDYRFNPSKGYTFNGNVSVGDRTIKKNAVFNPSLYDALPLRNHAYRMQWRFDGYIPIGKQLVVALANETGFFHGKYLLNNELFRIGGQKSLRGFNELSIFANHYSLANAELRYLLAQNSFLFAFYNQAWVQQQTAGINLTGFPLGFGTGINVETAVGILSISYALGKQKNNPLNLRQGKIHFGIVALF